MANKAREPEGIYPRNLEHWVSDRTDRFERLRVPVNPWHRPRLRDVRLEDTDHGPAITDQWVPDGTGTNCGPPVRVQQLLPRFLALTRPSPVRVLRFVQQFGCLEFTIDGIPSRILPAEAEPIAFYGNYARLAACTLRLAEAFRHRQGKLVPVWPEDIEAIRQVWDWYDQADLQARRDRRPSAGSWYPAFGFASHSTAVMALISQVINWWISSAGVRPYLHHDRDAEWQQLLALDDRPWGAIGLTLAAAVTQFAELRCEGCGRSIRRKHWHQGKPLYCPTQRCQQIKWRAEKRRQRTQAS